MGAHGNVHKVFQNAVVVNGRAGVDDAPIADDRAGVDDRPAATNVPVPRVTSSPMTAEGWISVVTCFPAVSSISCIRLRTCGLPMATKKSQSYSENRALSPITG